MEFDNGGVGVKDGKFSFVKSWTKVDGQKYMRANTKAINIHRKCGLRALGNAGVNLEDLI